MNRGKNLVEMIQLSSEVPYENAVLIPEGKKIYRYDPETQWFTERFVTGGDSVESEPVPVEDEAMLPASGWVEVSPSSQKLTVASLQEGLSQHRVLLGEKKTVPSRTKVPRLPVLMQIRKEPPPEKKSAVDEPEIAPQVGAAEIEPEPEPTAAPDLESGVEQVAELEPEPKSKAKEVKITFLPTPKKRQRKTSEPDEEEETQPPSRPLKVIRRRKEEEPKVFETLPKTFPTVLLEGVKVSQTESSE